MSAVSQNVCYTRQTINLFTWKKSAHCGSAVSLMCLLSLGPRENEILPHWDKMMWRNRNSPKIAIHLEQIFFADYTSCIHRQWHIVVQIMTRKVLYLLLLVCYILDNSWPVHTVLNKFKRPSSSVKRMLP